MDVLKNGIWKVEDASQATKEGRVNPREHQPTASSHFKSSQDVATAIFEVRI